MRSIRYMALETAVWLTGYKKLFRLDAQGLSSYIEKVKSRRKTTLPRYIEKQYLTRERTISGRPCYTVSPLNGANSNKIVMLLHGGGMFMEANSLHWRVASRLVNRLGVTVWLPAYPLVPGYTFEDITQMLLAVYQKMLEENPAKEISILGDSAGAVLSLMLCHHNKTFAQPLPMPKKLILVSPGMAVKDPKLLDEMIRILPHDPLLSIEFMDAMASIMRLSADKNDYFSAPFEGDFTGFPDMYIFSGTYEIFYAQMRRFVERMTAEGISINFYSGERMMHIWPYMPIAPESREALNLIFDIIQSK